MRKKLEAKGIRVIDADGRRPDLIAIDFEQKKLIGVEVGALPEGKEEELRGIGYDEIIHQPYEGDDFDRILDEQLRREEAELEQNRNMVDMRPLANRIKQVLVGYPRCSCRVTDSDGRNLKNQVHKLYFQEERTLGEVYEWAKERGYDKTKAALLNHLRRHGVGQWAWRMAYVGKGDGRVFNESLIPNRIAEPARIGKPYIAEMDKLLEVFSNVEKDLKEYAESRVKRGDVRGRPKKRKAADA